MKKAPVAPLMEYFRNIEDPRIERNKDYPLIEVIVIPPPCAGARIRLSCHCLHAISSRHPFLTANKSG